MSDFKIDDFEILGTEAFHDFDKRDLSTFLEGRPAHWCVCRVGTPLHEYQYTPFLAITGCNRPLR